MIAFFESESAALLRTPKVYNALITTDQNLTPSRAYPVIQPSLSDSAFFYGPYGYPPYGYYDPYGFNPFESATYTPKYNADGTIFTAEESVSRSASGSKDEGAVVNGAVGTEKAPIPLNEFGFPPSLIQLAPSKNPVNLSPFGYSSYPLIYDQFAGYPQSSYLPHFGILPQPGFGGFGGNHERPDGERIAHDAAHAHAAHAHAVAGQNGIAAGSVPGIAAGAGGVQGPAEPRVTAGTPPGVAGLDGAIATTPSPHPAFGNDASNPIYFDRENGVSQGGVAGNIPAGVYGNDPAGVYGNNPAGAFGNNPVGAFGNNPIGAFGNNPVGAFGNDPAGAYGNNPAGFYSDNGIGFGKAGDGSGGAFEAGRNDDVNNGGFRTAASNNGALGGVNSASNRGFSGSAAATSGSGDNNGGFERGPSATNETRLRGTTSSSSGFAQESAAGSSGNSASGSESFHSSSSSASATRSQGKSSTSSSSGSQQGKFVSALQNNSKV